MMQKSSAFSQLYKHWKLACVKQNIDKTFPTIEELTIKNVRELQTWRISAVYRTMEV